MTFAVEPVDEIHRLNRGFGLDWWPRPEDPGSECPICRGSLDEFALTLDIAGYRPLACEDCGAVLAA
jgi:hypothetical protein